MGMDMKFKLSDMERKANEGNLSKKKGYEEDLAALERDISSCEQKILLAERDIKETKATQSAYEKKRDQVFDEWKEESAKTYVDTLEFDENSIICPVCGRAFQEEKIEQIKADFEKSKADKKAKWEKEHEEVLEQIKQRGTMYKGTIVLCQDKVKEAEERIKAEQENLNSATVEKEKIEKLINELPEKVDISSDKEYQSLKAQMELQFDEKADKAGKPFSCQCWTMKGDRKVTGPIIDMEMAKAEGWTTKSMSKWKTMPLCCIVTDCQSLETDVNRMKTERT